MTEDQEQELWRLRSLDYDYQQLMDERDRLVVEIELLKSEPTVVIEDGALIKNCSFSDRKIKFGKGVTIVDSSFNRCHVELEDTVQVKGQVGLTATTRSVKKHKVT